MRSFPVVAMLAFASVSFAGSGDTRPPVLDVHLHTHAANRFGKPGVPNPVTGQPSAAITDDALMQAAFTEMRKFNIVAAMGFSSRDSVERWRIAAAGHIFGGAQIDQGLPLPDLNQLRRDIVEGRVRMIGEVGGQYLGLAPGDPSLEPYYQLAEELDVPVGVHTGIGPPNAPYECCPKFRVGLGNPALLEETLIRHPKLRVYLMHAGWPYLQETVALMSVYPQVYADLSVIDWIIPRDEFYAYLHALLRAGLGKRLMFGSDQMIWPEAIAGAVKTIETAPGVTAAQKRDIFYNNAVRFFRLKQQDLKPWR
jgi:predicted TIM-barrel fold metal-dependent hydrolase